MTDKPDDLLTLAIDIGGTRLKAGVLDHAGSFVVGPERVNTPSPADPASVMARLLGIIQPLGRFDQISVGFPGVVRRGLVLTAPNLGTPVWRDFPLADELSRQLDCPCRLLNDASVQGLGVISGSGLECVITLGTGFGFALFDDGRLAPHLEMGQHIARGKRTYDRYIGVKALEKIGRKHWNRRVAKALAALETLINYDVLLIGGGNAKHLDIRLPSNVRVVSNKAGITGGVRLWDERLDPSFPEPTAQRPADEPKNSAEDVPPLTPLRKSASARG